MIRVAENCVTQFFCLFLISVKLVQALLLDERLDLPNYSSFVLVNLLI